MQAVALELGGKGLLYSISIDINELGLSNGIYFYRLVSGETALSKPMVVVE